MLPLRFLYYSLRYCLLVALVAACSDGSSVPVDPPIEEPKPPLSASAELRRQIDAAKSMINSDTCFLGPDVSACSWGSFPYKPAEFSMTANSGEAILIIDRFPALPARAIRYKNRIAGYYRVTPSGAIGAVSFSWHAPTQLYKVLSSFASPNFVPARLLSTLYEPLHKMYGFYASESFGHGSYVFSLLVEANPHQPIVLLDSPQFSWFAHDDFCDASGSAESERRLRDKAQTVADEIRVLLRTHNVRFINYSSGITLLSVLSDWQQNCTGMTPTDEILRRKLGAYAPIMDVLFKSKGVFAAHASINIGDPRDYPYDLASPTYPNRLRAGYFTALDSGLDSQGRGDTTSLTGWPSRNDADVYLNSGVLPMRPYPYNKTPLLQVDEFGVSTFPISLTTTSWITPLALSRFIHARYSSAGKEELSDELITELLKLIVPTRCGATSDQACVFQDPLKHGQIESVRLGYVPRTYEK